MLINHPAVKKVCDINLGSVTIQPVLPGKDNLNIVYNGSIGQDSSQQIYLHAGFCQYANQWLDVADYPMEKTQEGWQYTINMQKEVPLHFCFKNNEDKWDNNNGANWKVGLEVF